MEADKPTVTGDKRNPRSSCCGAKVTIRRAWSEMYHVWGEHFVPREHDELLCSRCGKELSRKVT